MANNNGLPKTSNSTNKQLKSRDDMLVEFVDVAIKHMRLNSPRTAKHLISRAISIAHTLAIKKELSKLQQLCQKVTKKSLKKYIKSKKFDGKANLEHAKQAFYEQAQVAFLAVSDDRAKREGQFFDTLKVGNASNLPFHLPSSTKKTFEKAPVAILFTGNSNKIASNKQISVLESKLILVKDADVIGYNVGDGNGNGNVTPSILAKLNAIALDSFGYPVYARPLVRPSRNIAWFLVANIGGISIENAVFPEYLKTTHMGSASLDGEYDTSAALKKQLEAEKVRQNLLVDRQRSDREAFESRYASYLAAIKYEKSHIDTINEYRKTIREEFFKLTSLNGEDGLKMSQYYTHFNDKFRQIMCDNLLVTSSNNRIRSEINQDAYEARYLFFVDWLLHDNVKKRLKLVASMEKHLVDEMSIMRTLCGYGKSSSSQVEETAFYP